MLVEFLEALGSVVNGRRHRIYMHLAGGQPIKAEPGPKRLGGIVPHTREEYIEIREVAHHCEWLWTKEKHPCGSHINEHRSDAIVGSPLWFRDNLCKCSVLRHANGVHVRAHLTEWRVAADHS